MVWNLEDYFPFGRRNFSGALLVKNSWKLLFQRFGLSTLAFETWLNTSFLPSLGVHLVVSVQTATGALTKKVVLL